MSELGQTAGLAGTRPASIIGAQVKKGVLRQDPKRLRARPHHDPQRRGRRRRFRGRRFLSVESRDRHPPAGARHTEGSRPKEGTRRSQGIVRRQAPRRDRHPRRSPQGRAAPGPPREHGRHDVRGGPRRPGTAGHRAGAPCHSECPEPPRAVSLEPQDPRQSRSVSQSTSRPGGTTTEGTGVGGCPALQRRCR